MVGSYLKKYAINILKNTGMINDKYVDTPIYLSVIF